MKSYFQIEVPGMSLAPNRGASPDPAGTDPSAHSKGRLPGPAGGDRWKPLESRAIDETIRGGSITLELDSRNLEWRISPPAFSNWKYYLPATHGKWARNGSEIAIHDAIDNRIYFSLKQANRRSGGASYGSSFTGRYEFHTEWKRVPKPLPLSGKPTIWYGLAIRNNSGLVAGVGAATAIVISDDKSFAFSMPEATAETSRGYFWTAAFVLLTGYIDRGDLIAHPGSAVDYELSLGGHWAEQAAALNQIARFTFSDVKQFAAGNADMLRSLAQAAIQGTCVDYDTKHVIISDLFGAGIRAGIYAYCGECTGISQ